MPDSTWMQRTFVVNGKGRGLRNITTQVEEIVHESSAMIGLCHVFVMHTSASLVVQENADPDVLHDLNEWFERAVVDGDPSFRHRAEGPDDMSAHIRSVLTQTSVTIPVVDGCLGLGTWQGLYLFEHRTSNLQRRIVVTVNGAAQAP
ncbi:MAG: secondary thiamine-phosphate synthase enzyme YjbQ [Myxococcota bacterium]